MAAATTTTATTTTTTTKTTTITTTYHNQLGGEVSALSTDVGDVPAGLEESLAVAAGLGARHPYALLRLVRLQCFI